MSPAPAQPQPAPERWFERADAYWSSVPATPAGMLGGWEVVGPADAAGSLALLRPFLEGTHPSGLQLRPHRACDCGAGIGRVTETFLLPAGFARVDLVERNGAFLDTARARLQGNARCGTLHHLGLQEFIPERGAFDLIWIQWVLGHLPEADAVAFLVRCCAGLVGAETAGSAAMVGIKENVTRGPHEVVDEEDASVTRTPEQWRALFAQAGLRIVQEEVQQGFPAALFPVHMWLLAPATAPLSPSTS